MPVDSDHVGAVTAQEYLRIVTEAVHLVEEQRNIQFRLGDLALMVEPMRPVGGSSPSAHGLDTVQGALGMLSEDIGIPLPTLEGYRYVSNRWPERYRRTTASWWVYKILAADPDRFTQISRPPKNLVTGRAEWTGDGASRVRGNMPEMPRTRQEKLNRVHELTHDDEIASTVVAQLLTRPEVAHRAMTDPSARFAVNRAQNARDDSVRQQQRAEHPAVGHIEHSMGFYDLAGAGNAFISSVSRGMTNLRGEALTEDEKTVLRAVSHRVRNALDAMDDFLTSETTGLDAALARILQEGASS